MNQYQLCSDCNVVVLNESADYMDIDGFTYDIECCDDCDCHYMEKDEFTYYTGINPD